MKKITLFRIAFFVIIIFLIACNNSQDPKKSSTADRSLPNHTIKNDTIPSDCFVREPNGDTLTHQIRNACAEEFINDYQTEINAVRTNFPALENVLVYGAKVQIKLLNQIINRVEFRENGYDSLYVMLGKIDGNTHMIFALQKNELAPFPPDQSNYNPTLKTAYFDFTFPCPSTCPE